VYRQQTLPQDYFRVARYPGATPAIEIPPRIPDVTIRPLFWGRELVLSTGTRLGPYEIVSPLGAGGMGEVYRARDSKLGRSVAIKVLPSEVARDPETLDRFRREAKVLASLNHPNIASIYGFEDSDRPGLVMELVEGPTLADRILAGPLSVEEALTIAKQECEALEYAHERGIVHRDVKPANIKVAADGTVKLLDFGLAKALEDLVGNADISNSPTFTRMPTQAGLILGTAAYMSPEQAKGRPVDRRSDIWAFGCVLFEMLTGKMVFSGESVTDTLADIIKTEPDWSLIPASTPKPIRILLQRCLKKDVKQRLQAIGEARIILEEVLAAPGGTNVEGNEIAKGGTPAKRGRLVVGWIGGFAAGVVIASLIAWWAIRSGSEPTAMHFSTVTSFAGVQAQPALSPDGRSVAFVSNRDGHYNVYVGLVRGGQLVQITHDASMKSRPAWSPDGSTLAYAQMNDSGTMDIWEVAALGGSPRKVVLNATDPAWTPDGRSLAYVNMVDGTLWICGVEGENPRLLARTDPTHIAAEPRVSPDGKMVAVVARVVGPYGELGVADVSTGKFRLLTHDSALALSPAWSPDNRTIYFSSSRGGTLNIWKIGADGSGLRQVTAGEGDDAELDVSSDGKRLVFATLRVNIGIAQLDLQAKPGESNPKIVASDPAHNELWPVYSPDGTHIAFFTVRKGAENESIGIADTNGSDATQLLRDSRINLFPRWSPDGSRVIFFSGDPGSLGEFRSVAISGGAPQTIMQAPLSALDVGRDGRLLYVKDGGDVQVFDPRDGKAHTLGSIKSRGSLVHGGFARWSADGSAVVYAVVSQQENDPTAGIWVTDFKAAPRQVYRGWVQNFAVDAQDEIFMVKSKSDLNGELWKVRLDGSGLSHFPGVIPLLYNPNYLHSATGNQMDVSPDGRRVVFGSQQVLQENIGIIDNLP
jgi:eukaryotic-like serine/threonine-protein kinase